MERAAIIGGNGLVSIPKRVSEVLKLFSVDIFSSICFVSIPKRVSEVLKLGGLYLLRYLPACFNP